jgi:hypothetical protein
LGRWRLRLGSRGRQRRVPWDSSGAIGRSVDEPGRPEVPWPPLWRRDLIGNHQGSRGASRRGSLKTQQCVKSQCSEPRQWGRARAGSSRLARPRRRFMEHPGKRMSQQQRCLGAILGIAHPHELARGDGEPRWPLAVAEFRMRAKSPARPPRACASGISTIFDGEFDPGSGRTLAACLTHASRARAIWWQHRVVPSGERVSNTWATCP